MAQIIEITSLDQPGLEVYTSLTQAQLRNRLEPEKGRVHCRKPQGDCPGAGGGLPAPVAADGTAADRGRREGDRGPLRRCTLYTADREVLAGLTGYTLTRGVLCALRRPALPTVEQLCAGAKRLAVLENIVDSTNVGAIFRSAAALHMDGVLVTPSCCDPLCRRAVRVSMGTVFQVPWAWLGDAPGQWPHPGLERLKAQGFATAAMALDEHARSIDDPELAAQKKLAILLGTEGDGLAKTTIAGCDYTVCIPMSHGWIR